MDKVTDSYGLVLEGEFLTVYIPGLASAIPFLVKARANKGVETIPYGPLPLVSGETLPTYDGGSVIVPADGVIPARAYTDSAKTFPLKGAYDETDMWYYPADLNERLFHVIQEVTPAFLKCDIQIPKGVKPYRFQRDKVILGLGTEPFGFSRGKTEMVHLPEIRYGYRWGNETNINLYTAVKFTYAEYIVETVKDAETIFNILTKRIPSYWITLPVFTREATVVDALTKAYGITGYPIYPPYRRTQAINEYNNLIRQVKI
jgi:hypothetical protein